MKTFTSALALVVGMLAPGAVVAAPPSTPAQRDLVELREARQEGGKDLRPREPTCNTPSNRACWSDGFDINTDYEVSTPDTGVTQSVSPPLRPLGFGKAVRREGKSEANCRQYVFNLTEVDNWMGPDGVVKEKVMLINGESTANGMSSCHPK